MEAQQCGLRASAGTRGFFDEVENTFSDAQAAFLFGSGSKAILVADLLANLPQGFGAARGINCGDCQSWLRLQARLRFLLDCTHARGKSLLNAAGGASRTGPIASAARRWTTW